ncbi:MULTISPECIES: NAD-dependent epimerase/dehydratase family protein [Stappiaceae]|jgi:UDP-glucuronate 4-epimerase|uniref:NAD-dependent epimerase/dehydratase family protein n=1 Tax=Stappiaceae TaxID=2821832 RepID=UPI0012687C6A|nr:MULTISPECIES: NAD-dependent epimerase/dehydratase family protein [Stappiaceae]MEC9469141.1 NAD-dependent epimerase/dehydratase family protein [Pseudomonadota bacterium]MBN8180218.1 GDP-mannose 4,6-dehydratase [Roseibium aggregatum]MBO9458126.1 GDP-mannose 4,6-dehydratase [Labrenzia sp. R5_0]MEE2866947.1 NAD-dependent epimerase/dehydratase family protein [Pseudomonadota bacterium]NKI61929.1 NAD-dependent epimerase/dehydratase family protein [Labrenzia sp. PO1]
MKTVLVTGSAGFIGFYLCTRLLKDGFRVIGLDAMTDYYDVRLKERRQQMLMQNEHFKPVNDRVEAPDLLMSLFRTERPDFVIHLAAQAGVRYSIEAPRSYLESNICGTFELLEAARAFPPEHMLLASTSSAYGANTEMPYAETDKADHQMSFYAATKKATESMAHSYAHLYDLPVTMFRFFTVYGPWGRPDMALFKFTKAILEGKPIDVYNYGDMKRDFTYVEDLVEGIRLLMDAVPVRPAEGEGVKEGDSLSPVAPWRVVNIGNSTCVQLTEFIEAIEAATGRTAERNLMPIQAGDVPATWANADLLQSLTGYRPKTTVQEGVARFVEWYRDYYRA